MEIIDSVPFGGDSVRCTPLGRSDMMCGVYLVGGIQTCICGVVIYLAVTEYG